MTVGELVAAHVVDQRVWDADGESAANGIYLLGPKSTALPFVVTRAWKIGTGVVVEEVQFYGPSGRLVHRWGPATRRMLGTMDLTVETDTIEGAFFDEAGPYLVSCSGSWSGRIHRSRRRPRKPTWVTAVPHGPATVPNSPPTSS